MQIDPFRGRTSGDGSHAKFSAEELALETALATLEAWRQNESRIHMPYPCNRVLHALNRIKIIFSSQETRFQIF